MREASLKDQAAPLQLTHGKLGGYRRGWALKKKDAVSSMST